MPTILEAPETVEETLTKIRELPTYETPQSAPTQRPGLASKITAALNGMRYSKRTDEYMERCAAPEMPHDAFARKHPFMYADALFG